jgi:predicted DNA-binding WGR domain protein
MYHVKVLTKNKKGSKIVKKFKKYDNAKEYFNKLCKEDAGKGYFIYKEDE